MIHKMFIIKIWKESLQIKESNQCKEINEQKYNFKQEITSKKL